jgi:hypothetical protein
VLAATVFTILVAVAYLVVRYRGLPWRSRQPSAISN